MARQAKGMGRSCAKPASRQRIAVPLLALNAAGIAAFTFDESADTPDIGACPNTGRRLLHRCCAASSR